MSDPARKLFEEARRLSERERSELAALLIDSLDPAGEEGVDAAWGTEIRQRLDELQGEQVPAIPWRDARRLIMEDGEEAGEP
jgi:putative addiction module component (TIGR02574 family)